MSDPQSTTRSKWKLQIGTYTVPATNTQPRNQRWVLIRDEGSAHDEETDDDTLPFLNRAAYLVLLDRNEFHTQTSIDEEDARFRSHFQSLVASLNEINTEPSGPPFCVVSEMTDEDEILSFTDGRAGKNTSEFISRSDYTKPAGHRGITLAKARQLARDPEVLKSFIFDEESHLDRGTQVVTWIVAREIAQLRAESAGGQASSVA